MTSIFHIFQNKSSRVKPLFYLLFLLCGKIPKKSNLRKKRSLFCFVVPCEVQDGAEDIALGASGYRSHFIQSHGKESHGCSFCFHYYQAFSFFIWCRTCVFGKVHIYSDNPLQVCLQVCPLGVAQSCQVGNIYKSTPCQFDMKMSHLSGNLLLLLR